MLPDEVEAFMKNPSPPDVILDRRREYGLLAEQRPTTRVARARTWLRDNRGLLFEVAFAVVVIVVAVVVTTAICWRAGTTLFHWLQVVR